MENLGGEGPVDVGDKPKEDYLNLDDFDFVFDFKDLFKDVVHYGIKEKIESVKNKLALKQQQALKKLRETSPIQFKNKVSFVLGVSNVIATPYVMGAFPQFFPLLYTVEILTLILFRWIYYYILDWHYFMLDFCYLANALMMLNVWVFHESDLLFALCFSFANGPLLWSIPAFRNSMVFHEIDKITSVFIHMGPPLLTYCLRWKLPGFVGMDESSTGLRFILYPLMVYLLWQLLYYLKVYWNAGSFDKMTTAKFLLKSKQGFYWRICSFPFGEKNVHYGFMLMQLLYMALSMIPTMFLFRWRIAHASYILFFALIGIWNGANYYFEVFVRKYERDAERQLQLLKDFERFIVATATSEHGGHEE